MPMANDNDAANDPLEKPPAKVVARKRVTPRTSSTVTKAASSDQQAVTSQKKKAPAKKPSTKKAPAKKSVAKQGAVKKSAAKKPVAKKSVAKKAPAKKIAAKKAPAKKTPTPKVTTEKSPVKKTVAKKSVVEKAAAPSTQSKQSVVRKAASEQSQPHKAPSPVSSALKSTPVSDSGITKRPARSEGQRRDSPSVSSTQPTGAIESAALAVSVTEGLLNDVAAISVGEGIALDPMRTSVPLPGMGDVAVDVQLKILTAHTELQGNTLGSLRVHITAQAEVKPADDLIEPPVVLPLPPAPIPLMVTVAVQPSITLSGDVIRFAVPESGLTLEHIDVDMNVPAPEGVEANMWISMLAIFNMMLSQMGNELFENMLEAGPSLEFELEGLAPELLDRLGAQHGAAAVSISEKLLTVAFPGRHDIEGNAWPVPIAGKRAGVALSATSVNEAARFLLERAVSGLPVPFDVEVSLGEQHIGSRIRQSRLLPNQFPDFRSALRSNVRTRLVRGRVELSVEAIWVETPDFLPSFINTLSQRLGGLAGLAPLRIRLPEKIELPLPTEEPITIGIVVDDLRVSEDGVGAAVMLA